MAYIYGGSGPDTLNGTQRPDHIFGFGGADSLFGLCGNDTLIGGSGADLLDGGRGLDHASYASAATPILADLRTGIVRLADGIDRLVSIEAIDGGSAGDGMTGDDGHNAFYGMAGADTLVGNGGNDTLVGGCGNDQVDGGDGYDNLTGGAGNDRLLGGTGDDYLNIGRTYRFAGDSIVHIDAGRDVYDGGDGEDTLILDAGTLYNPANPTTPFFGVTSAQINLGLGTLRLNDDDSRSTVDSIENVWTGSGDDAITGSAAANYFQVGDGSNVVYAGGGNDTIIGGWFTYTKVGGDTLNGGAGNDLIYGEGSQVLDPVQQVQIGIGTDHLAGGDGNDTLWGGPGHAVLSGGAGNDLFVVRAEPGLDQTTGAFVLPDAEIIDFEAGDRLRIEKEFRDDTPYQFVGAVASQSDLDYDQVGYYHRGNDTILVAHLVPSTGSDEYMELTLVGYHANLTAANYDSSILV